MSAIERAVSHWADKLTRVRTIEVPEWADEQGNPLVIYVWPANMAQRNKIAKLATEGSLEALIESLVLRARDQDQRPLFAPKDREALMTKADPDVIVRICMDINSDLDLSDEAVGEAEKN